jgi:hypothetical protein
MVVQKLVVIRRCINEMVVEKLVAYMALDLLEVKAP